MNFFREMLSSDAKISSKRFVGFIECFMYISVVGLGVTAAEKFGKK